MLYILSNYSDKRKILIRILYKSPKFGNVKKNKRRLVSLGA